MTRIRFFWLITLLISLTFFACTRESGEVEDNDTTTIAERNVQVASAEIRDIAVSVNLSGRVESDGYVNITPSQNARVEKIHRKEGEKVRKGDVILELQDTQLVQAEQHYRNLERNYRRAVELYENDAIDLKSYEELEMAYRLAQTNYEFILENTVIRASLDGTIAMIAVKEGEMFNPMMHPTLVRIISPGKMNVIGYLSDRDFLKAEIGSLAEIRIDSASDIVFPGVVSHISPEADPLSGRFRCEILVNNRENLLRHNQFARINLLLELSEETLVIPRTAVFNQNNVFSVSDGRAHRREIRVGLINNDEVEILSGLSAGDLVVTVGNIGLTDNYPVNIIE